MCREAPRIVLTDLEEIRLRHLLRAHSTPQAPAFRARLVLRCAAADKPRNDHVADHVAAELGCDADTVSKWRRRFRRRRLAGLEGLPRPGPTPSFFPRKTAIRSSAWPPPTWPT